MVPRIIIFSTGSKSKVINWISVLSKFMIIFAYCNLLQFLKNNAFVHQFDFVNILSSP